MPVLILIILFCMPAHVAAKDLPIAEYSEALSNASPSLKHKLYLYRARAYVKQGDYQRALSDYDASLDLSPTAPGYLERGNIFLHLGEYAPAADDFSAALALKPGDLNLLRLRSQTYYKAEAYALAMADAERVLAVEEDDRVCSQIKQQSELFVLPRKQILIRSNPYAYPQRTYRQNTVRIVRGEMCPPAPPKSSPKKSGST